MSSQEEKIYSKCYEDQPTPLLPDKLCTWNKKVDTNWYIELADIDDVEAICVEGILFKTVEEARQKLDYNFYSGYGEPLGPKFTLWTKTDVYFPAQYDGSEWIECVPRHPCSESKSHVGA